MTASLLTTLQLINRASATGKPASSGPAAGTDQDGSFSSQLQQVRQQAAVPAASRPEATAAHTKPGHGHGHGHAHERVATAQRAPQRSSAPADGPAADTGSDDGADSSTTDAAALVQSRDTTSVDASNSPGITATEDTGEATEPASAGASLATEVLSLIGQSTAGQPATSAVADTGGKAAEAPSTPAPAPTVVPTPLPIAPVMLPAMPVAVSPAASSAIAAPSTGPAASVGLGGTAASPGLSADDDAGDDASATLSAAPAAAGVAIGTAAAAPIDHLAGAVTGLTAPAGSDAKALLAQGQRGELSALGNALTPATDAAARTGSATALTVNAPVGSPSFAQELGQQVAWLGGQDIKQAKIRLHPQDLGALDVKVSVEHGRVDVVFTAQHPAAASAVQQSLGQLSQMLDNQGLSLGQAFVGQQAQGQSSGGSQGNATNGAGELVDDDGLEAVAAAPTHTVGLGLVDAFA